jgi:hypothetical protein
MKSRGINASGAYAYFTQRVGAMAKAQVCVPPGVHLI